MSNKNSADDTLDSQNVTTDELQDAMSGYTSADALDTEGSSSGETHGAESLRDPMSGYASVDAIRSDRKTDATDVDQVHTEKTKDSMSGYASADALASDENE